MAAAVAPAPTRPRRPIAAAMASAALSVVPVVRCSVTGTSLVATGVVIGQVGSGRSRGAWIEWTLAKGRLIKCEDRISGRRPRWVTVPTTDRWRLPAIVGGLPAVARSEL